MPDDGYAPARDDGRELDAALRYDYFTSPGCVPQRDGGFDDGTGLSRTSINPRELTSSRHSRGLSGDLTG